MNSDPLNCQPVFADDDRWFPTGERKQTTRFPSLTCQQARRVSSSLSSRTKNGRAQLSDLGRDTHRLLVARGDVDAVRAGQTSSDDIRREMRTRPNRPRDEQTDDDEHRQKNAHGHRQRRPAIDRRHLAGQWTRTPAHFIGRSRSTRDEQQQFIVTGAKTNERTDVTQRHAPTDVRVRRTAREICRVTRLGYDENAVEIEPCARRRQTADRLPGERATTTRHEQLIVPIDGQHENTVSRGGGLVRSMFVCTTTSSPSDRSTGRLEDIVARTRRSSVSCSCG
jgi:hypothetical protein